MQKKYPVNLTLRLVLLVEPGQDGEYPSSFDVQDATREAIVSGLGRLRELGRTSGAIENHLDREGLSVYQDYTEVRLHEEQPGDAGGSQVRYTFAVGQMGPSSDGDGGSYYLTSIERPDPGLSSTEERGWAEGQLLEELEEQGDRLGESVAFVVYMGKEDVLEDAPEDEDAPEEGIATADFHCDTCGDEIPKGSDYLASLTKKFCGNDCARRREDE